MDNSGGKSFSLDSDSITDELHASCKGNPATNDWIPDSGKMVANLNSKDYLFSLLVLHKNIYEQL